METGPTRRAETWSPEAIHLTAARATPLHSVALRALNAAKKKI
jgi:hypothetical protein